MAEVEAEFAVSQSEKMAEQQAILDSIQDEAAVEANRRLIRQRQAEADAPFDELEAEESAAEQSKGRSCGRRPFIRRRAWRLSISPMKSR
ncbi:hypothetical protein D1007_53340 [Hordeum vulgare]|nr:hypothetical protein D1007_53340 [Hordeum vulgare]